MERSSSGLIIEDEGIITSLSGWNDGVRVSAMQHPDWSRELSVFLWDWFISSIVWLAPFEPAEACGSWEAKF